MRVVVLVLASWLLQAAAAAGSGGEQPTFRGGVDRVRVDVLVTVDRQAVEGLTARDFAIWDNGVPQAPEMIEAGGPVKVLLVLDTSASVAGSRFAQLAAASGRLIASLHPADAIGLITFSERVDQLVPLTTSHDAVTTMLARVGAGGRTALVDAVFAGLALGAGESGRWLVLVFSDGADTASWLGERMVVDAARRSSLVVCGVTVRGETGRDHAGEWIGAVAAATGGRVVSAESDQDLSRVFVDLLDEFRRRYVLAYTPRGVPRGDGWHELRVRVRAKGARVRARRGYMSVD